ncbi:hypothetical protein ACOMHN_017290 [Nucella lapillus]
MAEKYVKLAKIGQGTFGEVYKGRKRNCQGQQLVAMKKVLTDNEKEGTLIKPLEDFLYIGSSVNLRHRWANHKSDCKLRKGHKCHVAQHFLDKQHPVDPQLTCLRIFAIEAVHKKENLGKRETWWQVNVGTIFLGLNIRSDISALVRNRSRIQY